MPRAELCFESSTSPIKVKHLRPPSGLTHQAPRTGKAPPKGNAFFAAAAMASFYACCAAGRFDKILLQGGRLDKRCSAPFKSPIASISRCNCKKALTGAAKSYLTSTMAGTTLADAKIRASKIPETACAEFYSASGELILGTTALTGQYPVFQTAPRADQQVHFYREKASFRLWIVAMRQARKA